MKEEQEGDDGIQDDWKKESPEFFRFYRRMCINEIHREAESKRKRENEMEKMDRISNKRRQYPSMCDIRCCCASEYVCRMIIIAQFNNKDHLISIFSGYISIEHPVKMSNAREENRIQKSRWFNQPN